MTLNMKVESMHKFHTFEIPTVIKHGIGAIQHAGSEVRALGVTKALLVTDPGIYNAGVANPVIESLQEAGIEVVLFNKVEPNPPVRLVNEGSELYKRKLQRSSGCRRRKLHGYGESDRGRSDTRRKRA